MGVTGAAQPAQPAVGVASDIGHTFLNSPRAGYGTDSAGF
jgi:hypothetical protein